MPRTVPKDIQEAHDRWKFGQASDAKQRTEEAEDLEFDALRQWPKDILTERAGDEAKQQPGRPCLTINLLGQPVAQIDNAQAQAQFTPTVKPKGHGKASKQNCELAQGILRDIFSTGEAQDAIMWAAKRCNRAGRGYFMIVPRYLDDPDVEGPEAYDQSLHVEKILNQFCVTMDPTAKQPNKRDAKWVIITDQMIEVDYKDKYGKSAMTTEVLGSLEEWGDTFTQFPGWLAADAKGQRTIRVAHYIRVVREVARVVVDVQRGDVTKTLTFETGKGVKVEIPRGWKEVDRREIEVRRVKWSIINAIEELKDFKYPGQYLPVFEFVADEKNINGERIYQGLIRPGKDAQRSYNYMRSAEVEAIGLTPKAGYVADHRAIAQYQQTYNDSNRKNFAVLPYDSVDANGEPIPDARPKRDVPEPAIQAINVAKQSAAEDIRATTMVPEVSLGHTDPRYRAKGSILALQQQSDLATSGFMLGVKSGLEWAGEVTLDNLPHYYDRPGRIVQMLAGEPAAPQLAMIKQKFTRGKDGVPMPTEDDPTALFYDLTKQRMTVTMTVGRAFPTKQTEQQAALIEMMGASPELAHALAPLVLKYADWPGSEEAFTIAKRLLWPPDLQSGDGDGPSPQQLMQQFMQMAEQNKALMGELQNMQRMIEGKQLESSTKIRVAEIQATSAGAVAEVKSDTDLAKTIIAQEAEKAGIDAEDRRTAATLAVTAAGKKLDHAHEAGKQSAEQQHAKETQTAEHAHATTTQAAEHAHTEATLKSKNGSNA